MSLEDISFYLKELSSIKSIQGISITGGEPFLNYSLLTATIEKANSYKFKSRVVTNCFWGSNYKQAKSKLNDLRDKGLTEISVSYDDLHNKYIPAINVKNVVKASLELNLKVAVSSVTQNGNIAKFSENIKNDFSNLDTSKIIFVPGYIVHSGNAKNNLSANDLENITIDLTMKDSRLLAPCNHVIREPIIMPSGDLSVCCSPAVACRNGFKKDYVIGNAKTDGLVKLITDLNDHILFNILMLEGPSGLYKILNEKAPELLNRQEFVNICDLCNYLMSNTEALDSSHSSIIGKSFEMFFKKNFLNANCEGNVDTYLKKKLSINSMRPHK
jgi:MoaA/NifB/PqqE/SkfB family radical SAM enzyme